MRSLSPTQAFCQPVAPSRCRAPRSYAREGHVAPHELTSSARVRRAVVFRAGEGALPEVWKGPSPQEPARQQAQGALPLPRAGQSALVSRGCFKRTQADDDVVTACRSASTLIRATTPCPRRASLPLNPSARPSPLPPTSLTPLRPRTSLARRTFPARRRARTAEVSTAAAAAPAVLDLEELASASVLGRTARPARSRSRCTTRTGPELVAA